MNDIKLTFLGGASEIGASSTLLEVCGYKILIDCGVRFQPRNPLPNLDLLAGKNLDAILVTHAHSDHTGALPIVHSSFPGVPIIMTPPTIELIKILQKDALKLMDLAFEKEGELPLYQPEQMESMFTRIEPIQYLQKWTMGEIEVIFWPSSHIIGSAMIHITTPKGCILFTGDYCVTAQKTVPALERPPFKVDLLVTESTYGARMHSDRKASEKKLISSIAEVVMNSGRVLIPCFAIGRAQEVLLIIKEAIRRKKLPEIPVFVDGMVRNVCNIYSHYDKYVSRNVIRARREGHVFFNRHITSVSTPQDRQKVIQSSPCIIVASSGMLSGGPSAFYASHLAPCERDAIFITGYQDEESPGSALLKLAGGEAEKKEIILNNQATEVKCRFEAYSLSAHADRMQICGLVSAFQPQTTVLVHGDTEAKQSLKSVLPCSDVHVGWDGLVIDRLYRKAHIRSSIPPIPQVTVENIEGLMGNEPGPFHIKTLAEAFFGYPASPQELASFAMEVEETGLLKRDDNRRNIFKRFRNIVIEDNEADEEIKKENPKGKLNELCLKQRWPTPQKFLLSKEDGLYYCLLCLKVEDETWNSSQHSAKSRTAAEQLASRELFDILQAHLNKENGDNDENVTEQKKVTSIPQIKKSAPVNPEAKGILNSYVQKGLIKSFDYDILDTQGSAHTPIFTMCAKAILEDGSEIIGKTIQGDQKKKAQSLAASELLEVIHAAPFYQQKMGQEQNKTKNNIVNKRTPKVEIDLQTLSELANLIQAFDTKHDSRLPFRYLKKVAKKALLLDKFSDEEWLETNLRESHQKWEEEKTEIARQNGYYPFIQFTADIYHSILKTYDSWVLDLMKEHLDDPKKIFPKWAAQCAATMAIIGNKKCKKNCDNLYTFVTNHQEWENNSNAREKLSETLAETKLTKLRDRFSNKKTQIEDN